MSKKTEEKKSTKKSDVHFLPEGQSVTWCGIDINAHKGPVQFESQTDKADNVTCKKCLESGGVT